MAAQRKTSRAQSVAPPAPPAPSEWARPWLLAALVALCVARPMLPSEGVAWLGDGQPFDLLWLLVAAAWLAWVALRGVELRRWNAVDVAVATLVVISVASAVAGSGKGSPRFAMNMLWEWVGLGLVFILTRQLVRTGSEVRALVAVMVALAVALAAYGFYQVLVTLPADRAAYAEHPDELLRSVGQWFPPGSAERARFENRLASTEPLSTFALTNSLAGFLAAWLMMFLGVVLDMFSRRPMQTPSSIDKAPKIDLLKIIRPVALVCSILVIAGCLLLTKSRGGYVALLVGLVLLPLASARLRRIANWRFALAGGAAALALVGAAVATGRLDMPVLTEAAKSFTYRIEYWRATMAMIRHHFFLGVGPGNFQDYYTQYKLPEASEEVRDPHNFLLEIWATSGTLALVALCVALGALAWRVWRAPAGEAHADRTAVSGGPSRGVVFMLAGGAAGFVLAFLLGLLAGMPLAGVQVIVGLAIGAAIVGLQWPWVMHGALSPRLPALAALVLAIHMLAAGGIAFPGVAYTFWMLLAASLNLCEPAAEDRPAVAKGVLSKRARLGAAVGAVVAGAAAAACYYVACLPVIQSTAAMAKADEARMAGQQPLVVRLFWKEAADADPWSPEPWVALSEFELERLKRNPTDEVALRRFANATDQLNQVRSHSSAVMRQIAGWFLELYDYDHDPETLKSSIKFYRRAVAFYPASATLRGEYAIALDRDGQTTNARREAAAALALDAQTPHADKKLPAELKEKLQFF